MFMLRQTSVKMAVLLHKQASVRFHSLLTVHSCKFYLNGLETKILKVASYIPNIDLLLLFIMQWVSI